MHYYSRSILKAIPMQISNLILLHFTSPLVSISWGNCNGASLSFFLGVGFLFRFGFQEWNSDYQETARHLRDAFLLLME